jgi:ribonucleoside-diphosphate reductase alpha chain
MYYLRTKAATDAIKFTVDKNFAKEPELNTVETKSSPEVCSVDDENCDSCEG